MKRNIFEIFNDILGLIAWETCVINVILDSRKATLVSFVIIFASLILQLVNAKIAEKISSEEIDEEMTISINIQELEEEEKNDNNDIK